MNDPVLRIDYNSEDELGRVSRTEAVSASAWNEITQIAATIQGDLNLSGGSIEADWNAILELTPYLAAIRSKYGCVVQYSTDARAMLERFAADRRSIATARDLKAVVSREDLPLLLLERGFQRADGDLTAHQLENATRLLSMANGANFSVPGAGKTSVALAVHAMIRDADTTLLVVAPKNAFQAWDVAVDECIVPASRSDWLFTRLVGGHEQIASLLRLEKRTYIISYDQFVRVRPLMAHYIATRKCHVILDESHRIKAGDRSLRGAALTGIAHLPKRRDILSGTPMPHSNEDLVPQFDFLWPGQGLGTEIRSLDNPAPVVRPLYVRTTKSQLGLTPPIRTFVPVPMSNAQVALYAVLRDEVLARAKGLRGATLIEMELAKRSIVRLMQVSSNPLLLVRSLSADNEESALRANPTVRAIVDAVVEEYDSQKILVACSRAREFASRNEKCVIWSSFTFNVERISELLSDLGAMYIHGGVPTGLDADPATREYRLKRFHDDPHSYVLVANPAACGEAISLHRACHRAVYVDRSFNAAHYLQSVDRIHRLGLPPGVDTYIEVLESISPAGVGSLDYSVRRRMIVKLRVMARALNDVDVERLALEEEEADVPIDYDIEPADIDDLIAELENRAAVPSEDEDI